MPQAGHNTKEQTKVAKNKLAVSSQVRLGFASTYYTMAQALGLQKLQDYILVGTGDGPDVQFDGGLYKSICLCHREHIHCQPQTRLFGSLVYSTKLLRKQTVVWIRQ